MLPLDIILQTLHANLFLKQEHFVPSTHLQVNLIVLKEDSKVCSALWPERPKVLSGKKVKQTTPIGLSQLKAAEKLYDWRQVPRLQTTDCSRAVPLNTGVQLQSKPWLDFSSSFLWIFLKYSECVINSPGSLCPHPPQTIPFCGIFQVQPPTSFAGCDFESAAICQASLPHRVVARVKCVREALHAAHKGSVGGIKTLSVNTWNATRSYAVLFRRYRLRNSLPRKTA